jgi:hypothetical protein
VFFWRTRIVASAVESVVEVVATRGVTTELSPASTVPSKPVEAVVRFDGTSLRRVAVDAEVARTLGAVTVTVQVRVGVPVPVKAAPFEDS